MLRVLAIDDEPLALRQLVTYISKTPQLELAAQCQSALDAREFLRNDTVDAIFCDINMPDLDGLSFVKSLASPPLVVFTTAYSEYAVEGFRVEAVDYLLKPFGLDEFRRAADRLSRRIGVEQRSETQNVNNDSLNRLFVRSDSRNVAIDVGSIRYVQGLAEYVRLHLDGGRKPLITLMAMKSLEERLPAEQFMRIHRSYIINLNHIAQVMKNRVILDDGTDLPIGDSYRPIFEAYINKSML